MRVHHFHKKPHNNSSTCQAAVHQTSQTTEAARKQAANTARKQAARNQAMSAAKKPDAPGARRYFGSAAITDLIHSVACPAAQVSIRGCCKASQANADRADALQVHRT
jgi:hypothetical protein